MRIIPYAAAALVTAVSLTGAAPAAGTESHPEVSHEKRAMDTYTQRKNGKMRDAGSKTKYFHEPGMTDVLGHYDIRYFKGVVDYDVRTDTLHHLMRSYLLFFQEKGLETWIAHGTLLGWWWNGQILPWDWDIDTQVSGETLAYMASNLNRTTYTYDSSVAPDISETVVVRDYLLDVNPYAKERTRGDGMNIIDARWIDIRNGLYIDITGLSEVHPDSAPGVWSCKNDHKYRTRDLYPMRESVYEGVPAKVPYAYDKILLEEYHEKALVLTEYEGHVWNQQERLWMKKPKPTKAGKGSKKVPREPINNVKKRSWFTSDS